MGCAIVHAVVVALNRVLSRSVPCHYQLVPHIVMFEVVNTEFLVDVNIRAAIGYIAIPFVTLHQWCDDDATQLECAKVTFDSWMKPARARAMHWNMSPCAEKLKLVYLLFLIVYK
jgi:hypothetical protein